MVIFSWFLFRCFCFSISPAKGFTNHRCEWMRRKFHLGVCFEGMDPFVPFSGVGELWTELHQFVCQFGFRLLDDSNRNVCSFQEFLRKISFVECNMLCTKINPFPYCGFIRQASAIRHGRFYGISCVLDTYMVEISIERCCSVFIFKWSQRKHKIDLNKGGF